MVEIYLQELSLSSTLPVSPHTHHQRCLFAIVYAFSRLRAHKKLRGSVADSLAECYLLHFPSHLL